MLKGKDFFCLYHFPFLLQKRKTYLLQILSCFFVNVLFALASRYFFLFCPINCKRDQSFLHFLQDWFDGQTQRNYNNITQCVVEQYNKYFQRPLRIDSRSIMIEVCKTESLKYSNIPSITYYQLQFVYII